jgi:CTP synthase
MSGLGKGLVTASIGRILKDLGFKVSLIKIDPYLNVDAGTMSPYEHGEVFVTADGYEADQDLGLYERFMNCNLTRRHNITSGRVYWRVLQNERQGKYLGKTVQIIPHVTNEIISEIKQVNEIEKPDFCLVELGGTVGDIESSIFLEAARQISLREQTCFIHVA